MATSEPVAGPSRQYFLIPFRLDVRRETPTPPRPFGHLSRPSSSRSSTPIRPRSSSTFSTRTQTDEDAALLDRKRADSVKKMVTSWDLLREKYGSIGIHEDDEIDIRTGEILKNRGRLRMMEPRKDIGEDSDEEGEETPVATSEMGEESNLDPGSDEDELGGLDFDPQFRQAPVQRAWTDQDHEDLTDFLRAEAERKGLEGDETEGEEYWSSDEEGIQADTSRTSSPAISGDEVSSDGEESEDELLAFDPEATRKTPVPLRPRQPCLQVVIPSWSKRRPESPPDVPSTEAGPSRAVTPKRSKPSPRLRDLFTPPPASASPPQPTLPDLFSPVITTAPTRPSLTAAQKGKARMPSERPSDLPLSPRTCASAEMHPEDIDPPSDTERYFQKIHRLTPRAVRFCQSCWNCTDDPLRKQRAPFCKGRSSGKHCRFAQELGEEVVPTKAERKAKLLAEEAGNRVRTSKSEGHLAVKVGRPRGRPRRASAAHMLPPQTESSAGEEDQISPAARLKELREKRNQRKRRAQTTPSAPTISTEAAPSSILPPATPPPSTSEPKLPQSQSTDSDTDSWMFQVLETLPREMRGLSNEPLDLPKRSGKKRAVTVPAEGSGNDTDKSGVIRYCPLCQGAGGEREELATECRGRNWKRRCPYYTATPTPGPGDQPASQPSIVSVRPSPVSVSPAPPPVRVKKTARKRIITPISVSPARDVFDETTQSSPPPSSPPGSAPPARSKPFSHPTPSPTVSAEPDKGDPSLLWPPTSPLARRILPLPRGSHYAPNPTPPPSNLSRTSSLSSDRAPFIRPRSILRAATPSGPGSAPNSLKRARFSLRPTSPGVDSSDAFGPSDTESQDYEHESSSPWQRGVESLEPSSPFFSKELSVRAADAGFQLGLGHTGRITPGMMQALYPKYAAAGVPADTPSPDSSASTPRSAKPYTLPTPPRVSGTPSRTARSPSKAGSTAGLMLPPPVPPKRLGSASSSTPGPLTPSRSSVDPTPPISTPRTPARRAPPPAFEVEYKPIVFRTELPARIIHAQARARSRSVSAAPTRRGGSGEASGSSGGMARKVAGPATTPRKRNRSERELARLAREIGDDAGLEWGMDEDVGQEIAREGREGTVFMYLE